jgi:hypothetical protein
MEQSGSFIVQKKSFNERIHGLALLCSLSWDYDASLHTGTNEHWLLRPKLWCAEVAKRNLLV